MSNHVNILLPMPKSENQPFEELSLAVLDPTKTNVLILHVPEDTPYEFRSYLDEIQRILADVGIKGVLALPKSWGVDFVEVQEAPDDTQSNPR